MNEGKPPCWRPCLIDIQSRTLSTLTYLMSQPSYLQDVSRLLRLPEKPVPELDPYQKCISLCPDDLIIHNPIKLNMDLRYLCEYSTSVYQSLFV